jgi:hypothetical protein
MCSGRVTTEIHTVSAPPHNKLGNAAAGLWRPFVKGEKDGENRIVIAARAAQ